MKAWKWVLLIILPVASAEASGKCNENAFRNEKNVVKKFQIIKKQKNCTVQIQDYLSLSKQAYLSGNYTIGIWSARSGIKKSKDQSIENLAEFYYYLGISYIGKNRTEEAIIELKKIVFYDKFEKVNDDILQKSHMALIQAYYDNNQHKKKDQNINYLIRLFKNRHKKSELVYNLHDWNNKRYLSQK